jgi:hypothetical protein
MVILVLGWTLVRTNPGSPGHTSPLWPVKIKESDLDRANPFTSRDSPLGNGSLLGKGAG